MTTDEESDSSVKTIGDGWTDEHFVLFLRDYKSDDPVPSNVVINEDPFKITPWEAPACFWFLCNHEDSQSPERQLVRIMEGGYWKEMTNNKQISSNILGEGRKVFWEFYVGPEPLGDRTGWQMLEYFIKQKKVHEENDKQDFISLCRIFLKEIDMPISEDVHSQFVAEEVKTDCLALATNSQVPSGEEYLLTLGLGRSMKEFSPDNDYSIHSFDFSSEDYLELKDLEEDHHSASSFDNSSGLSGTSAEYFDPLALLRELGNEDMSPTESSHSLEVNQVANEQPPAESLQVSVDHLVREVSSYDSSPIDQQEVERVTPPFIEQPPIEKSLISGPGEASRPKRHASKSPEGSGSSRTSSGSSTGDASTHGPRKNTAGRMRRLGKKYCCLGHF